MFNLDDKVITTDNNDESYALIKLATAHGYSTVHAPSLYQYKRVFKFNSTSKMIETPDEEPSVLLETRDDYAMSNNVYEKREKYNALNDAINIINNPSATSRTPNMQTKELIVELRNRLLEDEELRKAFEKSIESALNECKPYMSESKIAEKILERLIG